MATSEGAIKNVPRRQRKLARAVSNGRPTEQGGMSEGIRRARSVQLKYLATLHQIGKPLEEPIVGRHFRLPERPRPADHPVFDMSLLYIPIYCHLVLHPPGEIVRPPTPELITRARMEKAVENWMD